MKTERRKKGTAVNLQACSKSFAWTAVPHWLGFVDSFLLCCINIQTTQVHLQLSFALQASVSSFSAIILQLEWSFYIIPLMWLSVRELLDYAAPSMKTQISIASVQPLWWTANHYKITLGEEAFQMPKKLKLEGKDDKATKKQGVCLYGMHIWAITAFKLTLLLLLL